MINLLFFFSINYVIPYIGEEKIKVDGKLNEEIWEKALKFNNFMLCYPYPFKEPSDKIELFILQSNNGLYFGFKCFYHQKKIHREDRVSIFLDTYFNKKEAYVYEVTANEELYTYMILDDGENIGKYEGIIDAKISVLDTLFSVEIFIPWKGLMIQSNTIGFTAMANFTENNEIASLTPFDIVHGEKNRVSKFLVLEEIKFVGKNITYEFLPTYVHFEEINIKKRENRLGLDGNIKVRNNFKVVFTYNPDFAEIEADPYRRNYTKYALFYDENRPFFLEGAEIFKFSTMSPLFVFYSRQIGKTLPTGKIIPIIFGIKSYLKTKNIEHGFIYSLTEKTVETPFYFPRTSYFVNSIKFRSENFWFSLITPFKYSTDSFKYLIGQEFYLKKEDGSFVNYQIVFNKPSNKNFAQQLTLYKYLKNFTFNISLKKIENRFNDEELGFIPWIGVADYTWEINYNASLLKFNILHMSFSSGVNIFREPDEPFVKKFYLYSNFFFKNYWNFLIGFEGGKDFEQGISYYYPSLFLFFSTDISKSFYFQFSNSFYKTYNYLKNFVGFILNQNFSFNFRFLDKNLISFNLSQYIEYDTLGKVDEITYSLRTRFNISPFKRFSFFLWFELPFHSLKDLIYVRSGSYISFNPKFKNRFLITHNYWENKENNFLILNSLGFKIKLHFFF